MFIWSQEMRGLQDILEGSSEEEGLKSLAREEQQGCQMEMQQIQVCSYWNILQCWTVGCMQESLLRALIPRDAADQNSAILEVRAGKSCHTGVCMWVWLILSFTGIRCWGKRSCFLYGRCLPDVPEVCSI